MGKALHMDDLISLLPDRFERKHYFYCDLPLGFQITQQAEPLASDGQANSKFDKVLI